jgi:GNAT superfamily N-acetyltransferase
MSFIIRPVTPEDAAAALGLMHAAHAWNLANGFNFTAADISAEALAPRLDPATFFVAANETLLGTVEIKPEVPMDPWHVPGDWGLHLLAVAPEAAGRGVGRALVDHAEALARAAGAARLVLDTPQHHPWLPAFYRRLGYVDIDAIRWDGKHYVSTILAKPLTGRSSAPRP